MQPTQLIGQEILTKLKAASHKIALDEVILLVERGRALLKEPLDRKSTRLNSSHAT